MSMRWSLGLEAGLITGMGGEGCGMWCVVCGVKGDKFLRSWTLRWRQEQDSWLAWTQGKDYVLRCIWVHRHSMLSRVAYGSKVAMGSLDGENGWYPTTSVKPPKGIADLKPSMGRPKETQAQKHKAVRCRSLRGGMAQHRNPQDNEA